MGKRKTAEDKEFSPVSRTPNNKKSPKKAAGYIYTGAENPRSSKSPTRSQVTLAKNPLDHPAKPSTGGSQMPRIS
jgi:hypothetical protein